MAAGPGDTCVTPTGYRRAEVEATPTYLAGLLPNQVFGPALEVLVYVAAVVEARGPVGEVANRGFFVSPE